MQINSCEKTVVHVKEKLCVWRDWAAKPGFEKEPDANLVRLDKLCCRHALFSNSLLH